MCMPELLRHMTMQKFENIFNLNIHYFSSLRGMKFRGLYTTTAARLLCGATRRKTTEQALRTCI